MQFVKATKEQSRLRMGFVAISGAGKTYSALSVAKCLAQLKQRNGRIAVIDTEQGSASKYSDQFDFDKLELEKPFSPKRYIEAMEAAAGYDVLIIDSISHLWEGEGGELDMVDAATKRSKSGNSFMAWRDVTPFHRKFIDAILSSPCHVICTMRAKTEYLVETNQNGKLTPRKVGTKPIQREGMEYEFDIVGDLDADHNFIVSKTRCPDLDGLVFNRPGEDLGKILLKWLTNGTPATPKQAPCIAAASNVDAPSDIPTTKPKVTPAAASSLKSPAEASVDPDAPITAIEGASDTPETPEQSAGESISTEDEVKAIFTEYQKPPAVCSVEDVRAHFPEGCKRFKDVPAAAYDGIVKSIAADYLKKGFFLPPLISKQMKAIDALTPVDPEKAPF